MLGRSKMSGIWPRHGPLMEFAAALLVVLMLLRYVWVPTNCTMPGYPLHENAAWLSVDWTSRVTDSEVVGQLAADTTARHLRYLFPFVSYVRPDGTFSPSFSHAAEFVSTFRRFDKHIRLLAWIGIPVRNTLPLGMRGWVNLADPSARQKVVDFATYLTAETGFDGVHLDIEPVANGNTDYLRLLEEVRTAIGTSRLLSVAGNHWQPAILSRLPLVREYGWNGEYLRAVAMRADQIVVMAYDSTMPSTALYRFWMREQVRGLNKALVNSPTQLILGISVSREVTRTHSPRAENLRAGLAGVCAALTEINLTERKVAGIAMYASWEADTLDWKTWEEWQNQTEGRGSLP